MRAVYFDTNVYTHIHNRQHGITNADVAKLFAKIRADKLRVYLSATLLEETSSAVLTVEPESVARLRLIHNIAKRKRILTRYQDIIEAVIRAYATNTRPSSFFRSPPPFLRFVLRNQSAGTLSKLREIAKESQQEIQKRKHTSEELFGKIWPLAKEEKSQGSRQSFENYWNEHAPSIAERFADFAGVLKECKEKGIDHLLKVTVMKTMTVGMLSQGYANTYEKASISRGDMGDLQHAVYASAIGTLVTHDTKFAEIMKRVPIEGFEVTDLHSLLSHV